MSDKSDARWRLVAKWFRMIGGVCSVAFFLYYLALVQVYYPSLSAGSALTGTRLHDRSNLDPSGAIRRETATPAEGQRSANHSK
jgi:hypothetical protein